MLLSLTILVGCSVPKPKTIITADTVDTKNHYDYSPTLVDGRMFWTCGLQTDTIISYKTKLSDPWHIEGKLVADPSAVRTPGGFLVLHTVGEPDGTRNGIGLFFTDMTGKVLRNKTIIQQKTNPARYGDGQPSIAAVPGDRYVVFHRTDGPNGESMLGAFELDSRTYRFLRRLRFDTPEDGASPEIFYFAGSLWMVLVGGAQAGSGFIGLRRYDYDQANGVLRRDRSREIGSLLPDGGVFWAIGSKPISNVLDGAAVVRDEHNDPVIKNGKLTYWRGHALNAGPGNWKIVRGFLDFRP